MTKAELIDRIAHSSELPGDVSKAVVTKVLDLAFAELSRYFVRAKLTRGRSPRFTFPKFGTFTKKKRRARRVINPRTLEPMEIEASNTVDFKPSVELKRQMKSPAPTRSRARRSPSCAVETATAPAGHSQGMSGREWLPEPPLQKVGLESASSPKTRLSLLRGIER